MEVFSFHNKGKRPYQEDSIHIDVQNQLFIICDGVGGQRGGSTASSQAIKYIISKFETLGFNSDIKSENVSRIINETQAHLLDLANADRTLEGMGTTLVLLYIQGKQAIIAHMGDSRLLHLPQNGAQPWSTKDHSFVQELFDMGILPSEEAMKMHPMSNRITKALSTSSKSKPSQPDLHQLNNLQEGDFLLLASDGALESFTSDKIFDFFNVPNAEKENKWNEFQIICEESSSDNNTAIGIIL